MMAEFFFGWHCSHACSLQECGLVGLIIGLRPFFGKKGLVPGLPPQQHPTYTKQDLTDAINDVTLYNDGRIFFWMALARLALVPPLLPPG